MAYTAEERKKIQQARENVNRGNKIAQTKFKSAEPQKTTTKETKNGKDTLKTKKDRESDNGITVSEGVKRSKQNKSTTNERSKKPSSKVQNPANQNQTSTAKTPKLDKFFEYIEGANAKAKERMTGNPNTYSYTGQNNVSGYNKNAITDIRTKDFQEAGEAFLPSVKTGWQGIEKNVVNAPMAVGDLVTTGANKLLEATGSNKRLDYFSDSIKDTAYGKKASEITAKANKTKEDLNVLLQDKGRLAKNVSEVSEALPEIALNLAMAVGTAGASTAAKASTEALTAIANAQKAGKAVKVAEKLTKIAKNPMMWQSFLEITGGTYADAVENGATKDKASVAAVANGIIGTAIEMGGGIEKLASEGVTIRTLEDLSREILSSMGEEASEEFTQAIVENAIKQATGIANTNIAQDGWGAIFSTESGKDSLINLPDMANASTMGAFGAMVGGSPMLGLNYMGNRNLPTNEATATNSNLPSTDVANNAVSDAANFVLSAYVPGKDYKKTERGTYKKEPAKFENKEVKASSVEEAVDELRSYGYEVGRDNGNDENMKVYRIETKDENGKRKRVPISATSRTEAVSIAEEKGLSPTNAEYKTIKKQQDIEAETKRKQSLTDAANRIAESKGGEVIEEKSTPNTNFTKQGAVGEAKEQIAKSRGSENALEAKTAEMSKSKDTVSKVVSFVEKRSGLKVVFDDSITTEDGRSANGYYDGKEIHVSKQADNPVFEVLKHELTHHLETSKMYESFKNFIFEGMQKNKEINLDAVKEEFRKTYKGVYKNDADFESKIEHEIVAEFCSEYLFNDEKSIRRLVETDPSLARRILNWIEDMIQSFKNYYKDDSEKKFLLDAQKMYIKALDSTGEVQTSKSYSMSINDAYQKYDNAPREQPKSSRTNKQIVASVNDCYKASDKTPDSFIDKMIEDKIFSKAEFERMYNRMPEAKFKKDSTRKYFALKNVIEAKYDINLGFSANSQEFSYTDRAANNEPIRYFSGKNAFLSNSYPSKITIDGWTFQSAEAAYQAQKDPHRAREFLFLTPAQAIELGKKVRPTNDWSTRKLEAMERVLYEKFSQNDFLKNKLLGTGNREISLAGYEYLRAPTPIHEDAKNPEYELVRKAKDKTPGELLMRVREQLREEFKDYQEMEEIFTGPDMRDAERNAQNNKNDGRDSSRIMRPVKELEEEADIARTITESKNAAEIAAERWEEDNINANTDSMFTESDVENYKKDKAAEASYDAYLESISPEAGKKRNVISTAKDTLPTKNTKQEQIDNILNSDYYKKRDQQKRERYAKQRESVVSGEISVAPKQEPPKKKEKPKPKTKKISKEELEKSYSNKQDVKSDKWYDDPERLEKERKAREEYEKWMEGVVTTSPKKKDYSLGGKILESNSLKEKSNNLYGKAETKTRRTAEEAQSTLYRKNTKERLYDEGIDASKLTADQISEYDNLVKKVNESGLSLAHLRQSGNDKSIRDLIKVEEARNDRINSQLEFFKDTLKEKHPYNKTPEVKPDSKIAVNKMKDHTYEENQDLYGTYKNGAPKAVNGLDVSSTADTLMAKFGTKEKIIQSFQDSINEGGYTKTTITNKDVLANAKRSLEENGEPALSDAFIKKVFGGERITSQDIANAYVAMEEINKLLIKNVKESEKIKTAAQYKKSEEEFDKTFKRMDDLAQALTEANTITGRALQANAMFKSLSPLGQLEIMKRNADRIGKKYNVNTKIPGDLQRAFIVAETQEKRNAVAKQINYELWRNIPSTVMEKLDALRFAGMLSAPVTHTRNTFGNVGMYLLVRLSNTIESGIQATSFYNNRIESLKDDAKLDVKRIKDKNQIILEYDGETKPSPNEYDFLKENGFEYNANQNRFYAKSNEANEKIANIILERSKNRAISEKNAVTETYEDIAEKVNTYKNKAMLNLFDEADRDLISYAGDLFDSKYDNTYFGPRKYLSENTLRPDDVPVFNQDTFAGRQLEKYTRGVSNALEFEDRLFIKANFKIAFAEIAKANRKEGETVTWEKLSKGQIEAYSKYAMEEAKKATFRDGNRFADAVNNVYNYFANYSESKGAAKAGKFAGKIAMDTLMPFVRTPANILKQGYRYSPAGLFNGVAKITTAKTAEDFMDGINMFSNGVVGSGIFFAGMLMFAKGMAQASFGSGDDEEYEKTKGAQQYSLRIGDNVIPMDWFAPAAMPFFVGVNLAQSMSDENGKFNFAGMDWDEFMDNMATSVEPMFEMSFLSGLQDFVSATRWSNGNMWDFTTYMGESYFSQHMPNFIARIAKYTSPTAKTSAVKDDTTTGKTVERIIATFNSKFPGTYGKLPDKVDLWGRTTEQPSVRDWANGITVKAFGGAAKTFLSPSNYSKYVETPVDKEIARLLKNTGNSSIIPSKPNSRLEVGGRVFNLDESQHAEFLKLAGQEKYNNIEKLLMNPKYKMMSDEKKVKAISEVYSTANKNAKFKILEDYGYITHDEVMYEQLSNHGKEVADSGALSVKQLYEMEHDVSNISNEYYMRMDSGSGIEIYSALSGKYSDRDIKARYSQKVSDTTIKKVQGARNLDIPISRVVDVNNYADSDGNGSINSDEANNYVKSNFKNISREQGYYLVMAASGATSSKNAYYTPELYKKYKGYL